MSELVNVADAYGKGRTRFMGLELLVAPGALVPRAETELLGNTALKVLREMAKVLPHPNPLPTGEGTSPLLPSGEGIGMKESRAGGDAYQPSVRVIDMCCGAGNLACAVAHHVPLSRVWATDLTDGCVELARQNVAFRELGERVSIHQGDLFSALDGLSLEGTIDMIICNPPYISDRRLEGDRAHLLELEPREAFAAGPYGIGIHMRVVKDALLFLRPGGTLLFEVGVGQDRQVSILFERTKAYEDIRVVRNEAGEGRVVLGRRKAA